MTTVQVPPRKRSRKRGNYRVWSPPESPLRIEYSTRLLREVRLAGLLNEVSGVLYGAYIPEGVRLIARREIMGLKPVGIFSSRPRGEVFLTEFDLDRFEESGPAVALVVAGSKGGFFVREPDGSIQSIKSYKEFSSFDPDPAPPEKPKPPIRWFAAAACALAIPLMAGPYFHPRPPIGLTVRDDAGELRISWKSTRGSLEISDGDEHFTLAISPRISSATYVRKTGDVAVRLKAEGREESSRFVGAPPHQEEDMARQQVADLEAQASELRGKVSADAKRIAKLEKTTRSLVEP